MATSPKHTIQDRPLRFSTPRQAIALTKTDPLPFVPKGRVLIVRGRTQSEVYHTWRNCRLLRGVARLVKQTYAEHAGRRPCQACTAPHQLRLPAQCVFDHECRDPAVVHNKAGMMCADHARIWAAGELGKASALHSRSELEDKYGSVPA